MRLMVDFNQGLNQTTLNITTRLDEDTGLFIPLDMLEQHVRERVAERGGLVL